MEYHRVHDSCVTVPHPLQHVCCLCCDLRTANFFLLGERLHKGMGEWKKCMANFTIMDTTPNSHSVGEPWWSLQKIHTLFSFLFCFSWLLVIFFFSIDYTLEKMSEIFALDRRLSVVFCIPFTSLLCTVPQYLKALWMRLYSTSLFEDHCHLSERKSEITSGRRY